MALQHSCFVREPVFEIVVRDFQAFHVTVVASVDLVKESAKFFTDGRDVGSELEGQIIREFESGGALVVQTHVPQPRWDFQHFHAVWRYLVKNEEVSDNRVTNYFQETRMGFIGDFNEHLHGCDIDFGVRVLVANAKLGEGVKGLLKLGDELQWFRDRLLQRSDDGAESSSCYRMLGCQGFGNGIFDESLHSHGISFRF